MRALVLPFVPLAMLVLLASPGWAACGYSGTNNQQSTVMYDGTTLSYCNTTNNWAATSMSGLANIAGSVAGQGIAAAVTNAGYQNFSGNPALSLPSAGTYFVSELAYYAWSSGCGDVFTHWGGSNIVNASMDGKWQACGNSGTDTWNTYDFVITVSAATTLNAQYNWTNASTVGSAQFGGAQYIKIGQ